MNRRPVSAQAAAALAAAARAGPYFAVEPRDGGAGWHPLSALVSDPAVLRERVAHAGRVLARGAGIAPAAVPPRVAASVVFGGLASRLVSPALGAAVLGGVVPVLTVDDLWWRPVDGGPWPLAARPADGVAVGGLAAAGQLGAAAALISEHCVQGIAGPVSAAFGTAFRLSPQVRRGNVASALAGAAGVLAAACPERAGAAWDLTAAILAQPPLRGAGELVQPDPAQPRRFLVRRSCCLIYRIPGAGTCGDCVLRTAAARPAVAGRSPLSPG